MLRLRVLVTAVHSGIIKLIRHVAPGTSAGAVTDLCKAIRNRLCLICHPPTPPTTHARKIRGERAFLLLLRLIPLDDTRIVAAGVN